ncbi:hypothetical protein A33M_2103 [Rhodovulum sp. PH10]|uniref:DUF2934 domain-containing protein n=1 Tax=Rhodovulum sp. PH10 TaxID=1187851 RepID=UPI00027C1FFA|nr:DUF2934 domain-containing protein [Rhodovulum sp. PH10]EJW12412.1 hypothetical protein A33M_2103 [Rhodovulum sp. PH10]
MDDFEQRVRERAYRIWQEAGCPEGQADANWELARELVAIEENQKLTTLPVERDPDDPTLAAEEVEPAGPAANAAGELPTLTDEGEQDYPPHRPRRDDEATDEAAE